MYAVILAAGVGSRFGTKGFKQLLTFNGKTVIEHSVSTFESVSGINELIVVVHPDIREKVEDILSRGRFDKPIRIILGGGTRLESSRAALELLGEYDWVLIHDAVRPFLSTALIERCLDALENHDAVYPVLPSTNTIVRTVDGSTIADIPLRQQMMIGQTPQGFKAWVLRAAHERALSEDETALAAITNDCGLVQRYGICPIHLVEGERQNIKITYPEDERLGSYYLELRDELQKSIVQKKTTVSVLHGSPNDVSVRK